MNSIDSSLHVQALLQSLIYNDSIWGVAVYALYIEELRLYSTPLREQKSLFVHPVSSKMF